MITIDKKQKITLTQGDDASVDIRIFRKDGVEDKILPSDTLILTVIKSGVINPVITKEAYENSFIFVPEDTADLEAGLYTYQVELIRDGEHQTVIPTRFFEIAREYNE